jgi:hypothetical protein
VILTRIPRRALGTGHGLVGASTTMTAAEAGQGLVTHRLAFQQAEGRAGVEVGVRVARAGDRGAVRVGVGDPAGVGVVACVPGVEGDTPCMSAASRARARA